MGGRPRSFSKEDRALVRRMSAAGAPKVQIAKALGCHPSTIKRHFRKDLLGKKPRGVPAREFTEAERNLVSAMVSFGISQPEIARVLEIALSTFRSAFVEEIATGATKANAAVASSLYDSATRAGSVRAQVFWLQSRAGWKPASDELPADPVGAPSLRDKIGALDPAGRSALKVVLEKMGARSALTSEPAAPGDPIQ